MWDGELSTRGEMLAPVEVLALGSMHSWLFNRKLIYTLTMCKPCHFCVHSAGKYKNVDNIMNTIFALGLAMMILALLSSYLYKKPTLLYNSYRCNLLPLTLRNCSILLTSCCFEWGPLENNGSAIALSFFIVSKNVRKQGPLKMKIWGHLLFWHFVIRARLSQLKHFRWDLWCTHYTWPNIMYIMAIAWPQ